MLQSRSVEVSHQSLLGHHFFCLRTLACFTPEAVFIEYLCFAKLFINFYTEVVFSLESVFMPHYLQLTFAFAKVPFIFAISRLLMLKIFLQITVLQLL